MCEIVWTCVLSLPLFPECEYQEISKDHAASISSRTSPALRLRNLSRQIKILRSRNLFLRYTYLLVGLRRLLSENGYAGKRVDQGLQTRNTRDETAKYQGGTCGTGNGRKKITTLQAKCAQKEIEAELLIFANENGCSACAYLLNFDICAPAVAPIRCFSL
jgi:hypothetical protein